jgi:hypothetical protein
MEPNAWKYLPKEVKRPKDIFDLWFFHQTTFPGPMIQGLKPFEYRYAFEFAKIFDIICWTAVSMIPQGHR